MAKTEIDGLNHSYSMKKDSENWFWMRANSDSSELTKNVQNWYCLVFFDPLPSLPPSSSDYVMYGWVPNGILLVSLPPPLLLPLAAEAVTLFSKGITSSSQDLKQINLLISSKALHPMFLEHWKRQKIFPEFNKFVANW